VSETVGRRLLRFGLRTGTALLLGLALLLVSLPAAHPPRIVHADQMAIPIPLDIGPDEHWVDVNLSQQVAVAMDGSTPVRVIFVTTGGPGWETPTGTFHVLRRVEDETMTSSSLGIPIDSPGGYDLQHVMYTQYFTTAGHALHDNYWQPDSVFGSQPTSHGCVGMQLDDAHYLWNFLTYGSRVVIHY
jgi:lipoprotein-anchoring transpeptidase ErfK/SrfK